MQKCSLSNLQQSHDIIFSQQKNVFKNLLLHVSIASSAKCLDIHQRRLGICCQNLPNELLMAKSETNIPPDHNNNNNNTKIYNARIVTH